MQVLGKNLLTFEFSCGILFSYFMVSETMGGLFVEEKYGAKFGVAKTLPLAVSGLLMVAFVFIIAGAGVLGYQLSNSGSVGAIVAGVILALVGLLMLAYCVKTIMGNVTCYENAIVITQTFKTIVIPREDIAAIYWERPGANASNEKVRTNVNIADIILAGGRKHYKISDGYYSNVEVLGLYQNKYDIPMEIKR